MLSHALHSHDSIMGKPGERSFRDTAEEQIRWDLVRSVDESKAAIMRYWDYHNTKPHHRLATPESILANVAKAQELLRAVYSLSSFQEVEAFIEHEAFRTIEFRELFCTDPA